MRQILKKVINKLYTNYCSLLGATVGKNAVIASSVYISSRSKLKLGKGSILYDHCTLHLGSGSFTMGEKSHMAPYGYVLSGKNHILIGNDVAIGPYSTFFCMSNSPYGDSRLFRENYKHGDIRIGNNVFIGAHTVILPGCTIPDNVVIAANSVAGGHLESGWIYGGNPLEKRKKINL